jgi:aminoglycoside phosphotransferase (APT) family kinase protein
MTADRPSQITESQIEHETMRRSATAALIASRSGAPVKPSARTASASWLDPCKMLWMPRMHVDELEISEEQVHRLLARQFPEWAELLLERVEPAGTDNAIFRLGNKLSVRLARRNGPAAPGGKEFDWLPRLAPLLPLAIPVPVAQGRPTSDYPWFWNIHTWVDGETVAVEDIDAMRAARDLAAFVAALQVVDPLGAPLGRGIPLAERDEEFRYWLARFDGDPAVVKEWERALAAPPWNGPPVWHHGDLDARNWLVREGRICGVIDWGATGVGDPACDVMVAWKLHSGVARDAFRDAMAVNDATWERARGWVLSQAIAVLAYYTPENNLPLYREAELWLQLVMSEREERG